MLLGRVVFGIGCESMYVGQSAIVSNWFINYELPLAISIISCVPLCGSFINGAVVPSIYNKNYSFFEAFGVGFILCCVTFVIVLFMACLDYKMEETDAKKLKEF